MRKSRPILFCPAMSWAVIDGDKTQTRRPVESALLKIQHGEDWKNKGRYGKPGDLLWVREEHYRFGHWREVLGVRTKTGRQKWAFIPDSEQVLFVMPPNSYRKGRHHKDPETKAWHKRLARFMPRSICRTTVEIVDIRVERLQQINISDVEAEGIERRTIANSSGKMRDAWASAEEWGDLKENRWEPHEVSHAYAPHAYGALWNKINGADSEIGWDKNPWVWVIIFKILP